ncbi:Interacting inhibitor of differentiation [Cucumispora dikerogammari]|nr:Interacting inhibitor of differentiation [Cucumispora dikerogammari]
MLTIEQEYLEIIEKIKMERQSMEETDDILLSILQERANELFDKIENTNELKLDAKFKKVSNKVVYNKFAKSKNDIRISCTDFVKFLTDPQNEDFFKVVSSCYDQSLKLRIPKTFKQPLGEQKKIKTTLTWKYMKENISPLKTSIPEEEEDIIDSMINKIVTVVRREKKVEWFRLILNPFSYSKTIENVFYLSFANKMGKINIFEEESKIYVQLEEEHQDAHNNKIFGKQHSETQKENGQKQNFIFNIELFEYEELIKKLKIKTSML